MTALANISIMVSIMIFVVCNIAVWLKSDRLLTWAGHVIIGNFVFSVAGILAYFLGWL